MTTLHKTHLARPTDTLSALYILLPIGLTNLRDDLLLLGLLVLPGEGRQEKERDVRGAKGTRLWMLGGWSEAMGAKLVGR